MEKKIKIKKLKKYGKIGREIRLRILYYYYSKKKSGGKSAHAHAATSVTSGQGRFRWHHFRLRMCNGQILWILLKCDFVTTHFFYCCIMWRAFLVQCKKNSSPLFRSCICIIDPRELKLHSKHFKWNGFNCITRNNEENQYNLEHFIYLENKFQIT